MVGRSEIDTQCGSPHTTTKTYEGTPCEKCGSTKRYIANRLCVACNAAYARTERAKASAAAYARTEKAKVAARSYRQSDRSKALVAAWLQTEVGRASQQVRQSNRRARQANVEGRITAREWIELKHNYLDCCFYCHKHESECEGGVLELDHIIPLRASNLECGTPGTHTLKNIQPLCRPCRRDRARHIRISSISEVNHNPQSYGRAAIAAVKAAEVRQLFRQGISKSEIAWLLDIGRTSVRRILGANKS